MRRIGVAALLALLAGCATGPTRQEAMQQFIGADEATLVAAMGVPTRTFSTGNLRFLAYDERRTEVLPSPGPMWGGWGWGWYNPFPPQVVTLGCETTFQVYQGHVTGFTLRGNAC